MHCDPDFPEAIELNFILDWKRSNTSADSGYVVDSLFSAKQANEKERYEEVVKFSIKLGHDTDTTACIAGGIAGLRFCHSAIPKRWINGLRGESILSPLLAQLLS